MRKYRSHPINILEKTSKFLILLLIPILRTLLFVLLSSDESFAKWFKGVWLDLIIVALIIGLGIYNWYLYVFSFDDKYIYLQKGIIFKNEKLINIKKITSLSINTPWYYRPFNIIRLKADTDGGAFNSADFLVTVKYDIALQIANEIKTNTKSQKNMKKYYIPHNLYLAIFSFLTSNSLTGAIYLSASISQIGNFFGKDIQNKIFYEFKKYANALAFGLPPIAVIIAYIILLTWFLSFLLNFFRNIKFCVIRQSDTLEISSKFISKRYFLIKTERINAVITVQSLLTKLFHLSSILIDCTGYGKHKGEIGVLFPCGIIGDLKNNLKMILPQIEFAKRQIKPKLVNLSRFLIPPLTLILVVVGLFLIGLHYVKSFKSTLIILFIIVLLPCIWWLFVKIFSFIYSGIGTNDNTITLYYTFGYQILSVCIPKEKISKIEISQTLFQISTKCCDVTFHTYGEGLKHYKVLNLNIIEVKDILNLTADDLSIQTDNKFTLWRE